ncbi:MAG: Flp pilus assembly protein CpaB [Micropepsaceae bacterium]
MDMTRILILVGALGAAGVAAFLARGLMGGQNEAVAAENLALTEIMVASHAIEVGAKILPGDLKWQGWPKTALDASFITKEAQPQALEDSAEGSVARMPLVTGEPVTAAKVIKADGAGFLAAVLTPGKRAVGVKLSVERGAGGFILPNDRVDVIMTRKLGADAAGIPSYRANTILRDVRVLAIDQTSQEEGDSKSIVGKSATLELSAQQAEIVSLAEAMGDLSLSLRSLTSSDQPSDDETIKGLNDDDNSQISVMRFGIPSQTAPTSNE